MVTKKHGTLWVVAATAVIAAAVVVALLWREHSAQRDTEPKDAAVPQASGQQLARTYCGGCHPVPTPDLLPRRSWRFLLSYMGLFLGRVPHDDALRGMPGYAVDSLKNRSWALGELNRFPPVPTIDEQGWELLRAYYLDAAPDRLPAQDRAIERATPPAIPFRIAESGYEQEQALTTLVKIDDRHGRIFVGDSRTNTLTVLNRSGPSDRTIALAAPPVDVEFDDDGGFDVLLIGDLQGTTLDSRPASIVHYDASPPGSPMAAPTTVVDGLHRSAGFARVDLDRDGMRDLIVAGFGGSLWGASSWFHSDDGTWSEHVLVDRPGTVALEPHDIDGDGLVDIVALVAGAVEGLYWFKNLGGGQFERATIQEQHPSFGYTSLQLVDVDADGHVDILTVNGDNPDSDPYNTPKPFHGVRLYLGDGSGGFAEEMFYPLYGAYMARAADYDMDGDVDIAAVAFYPDFGAEHPESFVYLENRGALRFVAHAPATVDGARWMVMDAGDYDGDGDIDLVLGGAYHELGVQAYPAVFERQRRVGPALQILENTTR
jgi:hypothetical protein